MEINRLIAELITEIERRRKMEICCFLEVDSNEKYILLKHKIKSGKMKGSLIFCDLTINSNNISKLITMKKLCKKKNVDLEIITREKYYSYVNDDIVSPTTDDIVSPRTDDIVSSINRKEVNI